MADTISSASITALDAFATGTSPIVEATSGAGAAGFLKDTSDFVLPTTGGLASTASKYKMIRLPWNIKLKELILTVDAGGLDSSTGLSIDVGAYYSDSTVDGTPAALQGTAVSVNCFDANDTALRSSAVGPISVLKSFGVELRNEHLWAALGLSSNPGGFVDVVVAVHTAATTAVASDFNVAAHYVMG